MAESFLNFNSVLLTRSDNHQCQRARNLARVKRIRNGFQTIVRMKGGVSRNCLERNRLHTDRDEQNGRKKLSNGFQTIVRMKGWLNRNWRNCKRLRRSALSKKIAKRLSNGFQTIVRMKAANLVTAIMTRPCSEGQNEKNGQNGYQKWLSTSE
ncbi:hypothetical protein NA78x_005941 [Anatilimnocola sp. NA78]|uniref:hypothetical protein n=1 Tax=Anatilimnocola sp. NA78 TaxID=3415683 RepID=UPI003CE5B3B0